MIKVTRETVKGWTDLINAKKAHEGNLLIQAMSENPVLFETINKIKESKNYSSDFSIGVYTCYFLLRQQFLVDELEAIL